MGRYFTLMLAVCASYDDVVGVRRALADGANPDFKDKNGVTPIIHAVKNENIRLLRLLIDAHADVNVVSPDGSTPLHLAVKSKNLEMVKTLIDVGADVNATDVNGFTLAMLAARAGSSEILDLLLRAGIDVRLRNADGNTALHLAMKCGYICDIKTLIKAGADINAKGNDGMTPTMLAVNAHHYNLVKYLIKAGADLDAQNIDGNTVLHLALEVYTLEVIIPQISTLHNTESVITNAVLTYSEHHMGSLFGLKLYNPGFRDILGSPQPPYMMLEMVRTLVEAGANVNAKNEDGVTPAMLAVRAADNSVLTYLTAHHASLDTADALGNTVLHHAVERPQRSNTLHQDTHQR